MSKKEIVDIMFEKIIEIEKEVSNNYIGKLTTKQEKSYLDDVVGNIVSELNKVFDDEEVNGNEN